MKNIARKLGLLVLLAAAFTVAGHIYEHCNVLTAGSYASCGLCGDIQGASAHAVPRVDAALVLLFTEPPRALPAVSAEKVLSEVSRAPPGAFLS